MEIFDWKDLDDGGAAFTVDMTYEELVLFAKEGVISTMLKAAKVITEQHAPVAKDESDLGIAFDNIYLTRELEKREKEIENLHIYKKAIMKMCSHRQREIDDYVRIAKQAAEDDQRNYYERFPTMDTRKPHHEL